MRTAGAKGRYPESFCVPAPGTYRVAGKQVTIRDQFQTHNLPPTLLDLILYKYMERESFPDVLLVHESISCITEYTKSRKLTLRYALIYIYKLPILFKISFFFTYCIIHLYSPIHFYTSHSFQQSAILFIHFFPHAICFEQNFLNLNN